MIIKAVGIITSNKGDGRIVEVNWKLPNAVSDEWYFYTYQPSIWRVTNRNWKMKALIDFSINGIPQDLNRFRNSPYWKDRFGDKELDHLFLWTKFYEQLADSLLPYSKNRSPLLKFVKELVDRYPFLSYLKDRKLQDICPFTVFGMFNLGITEQNRKLIASEFSNFFSLDIDVPISFEGIPTLNNQNPWFLSIEEGQKINDVDMLWELFNLALSFNDIEDSSELDKINAKLIEQYDIVSKQPDIGRNITVGLHWIRPWQFLSLDIFSQQYIEEKLTLEIDKISAINRGTGYEYFRLLKKLEVLFDDVNYPVHSFPDLSLAAYRYGAKNKEEGRENDVIDEVVFEPKSLVPYDIKDIINDGCFLPEKNLVQILSRLEKKKNIILQGPPGTGKTWLGKRLAYALIGYKDDSTLKSVQFHPNLSYEDFIRGWRPSGNGKLELIDGPFMEMIKSAIQNETKTYVIVIEEINRGNPAQIFGEMLTLLENDKRTPTEALELSYKLKAGERVYIPQNLFVIGTMNIADRSLALVDLALRRRFSFIDLRPCFNNKWLDFVNENSGIPKIFLQQIATNMKVLNKEVIEDVNLGEQFVIGHSYVTPASVEKDYRLWYTDVVDTELIPLLREYWFDDLVRVKEMREILMAGI